MLTRRAFVGTTGACLGARVGLVWGRDDPPGQASRNSGPTDRARRFLIGLLDREVGLLPEFPGSRTFWLVHDNYLAAKVLRPTSPGIASEIESAIRRYEPIRPGKVGILFDESPDPLPFRHYRLREVRRIGDRVIRTEDVGERIHTNWDRYADLLFLAAIAQAKRDPAAAGRDLRSGLKTWDGQGFRDRVSEVNGQYATFKLALALLAGNRLGRVDEVPPAVRDRLRTLQRNDGGFVTDYDRQGKPVGEANVETTALSLLALEARPSLVP